MITLKRDKGSALSHDELDDNFQGSVNIFDAQTVNGIKTFASSPLVPTPIAGDNTTKVATTAFVTTAIASGGNYVTIDTPQDITGQKTFTNLIKTDGIISILNTNGGGYIDVNDGNITIGTGLNSASNVPEITITNAGYGQDIIFDNSGTFRCRSRSSFTGGLSTTELSIDGNLYIDSTADTHISTEARHVISSKMTMFSGWNGQAGTMMLNGDMNGRESSSTDWDTNNIIDLSKNAHFEKTVTSNITISFKSMTSFFSQFNAIPSDRIASKNITIALTNGVSKVSWPLNIRWAGRIEPTLTSGTDLIGMTLVIGTNGVIDGYGYIIASNMSTVAL
jgi:hypothetical protein